MYHSIVIEESLKDRKVMEKYKILRTKIGEEWHLNVVELSDPEVFTKDIQSAMVTVKPYYFHIYNDDNYLKVIFKDKVFDIDSKDKNTWIKAQKYGGDKLNIPSEELDFTPNDFQSEDDWFNNK